MGTSKPLSKRTWKNKFLEGPSLMRRAKAMASYSALIQVWGEGSNAIYSGPVLQGNQRFESRVQ
jgi:hypothetical protein